MLNKISPAMLKLKSILLVIAISSITSAVSVCLYGTWMEHKHPTTADTTKMPVQQVGFREGGDAANPADFTMAATTSSPAVVHIQTHISRREVSEKVQGDEDDPFAQFFSTPRQVIPEQRGSGSGVILSEDGYIVTNNHVIDGADNITVTLANHKVYKAMVVGTDSKTDLAVLKIAASHLPFVLYGNSDDIDVGQWVLAIGYPWNLDITVTAGIISAKTRTIGIDRADHPVETFIQTDAAVNLGNSGGALLNTKGELIGINTALASPTGAYAGYSYAIPVNIVKKTVNELIKYGMVKGNKS